MTKEHAKRPSPAEFPAIHAAAAPYESHEDLAAAFGPDGTLNDGAALEFARAETRLGQADLRVIEVALAASRVETKVGQADLRVSEAALASSRAETKVGQADLLASEVALAASQVETKVGQADLLASETALAASQVETKIGLADLLASAVELAASRAETKISVRDLLASAVALSLSRAETLGATKSLHARESQIASITKHQELLSHVVEALPTALILVDSAGQIAMVNAKAESMFGYPRAELHGKTLEVLLAEKSRVGHARLRADFLSHMASRVMGEGRELFGLRKDGTQFPLEIGLNPIDLDGEIMVLAGVTNIAVRLAAEAVTLNRQQALERSNGELIRARLRAEQATRAKSRFLAGMSHELRTPLNGILGYAQLLKLEGGLTPMQAARVNSMRSAGQHLLEMITSVLDLSEVEAGKIVLQTSLIDLRGLAQDCLEVLRPSADARDLTLRLTVAGDVPHQIVVDRTRLRQVLLNLLANAVKFTDKGGVDLRLSLTAATTEAARLRIEIVDTGRGIPADRRGSLFQDYERLDADAEGAVEGAGLGLAISAHLVGLMGSRIVHDDNPGGGSVFRFDLPLENATDPAGARAWLPGQTEGATPGAPLALPSGLAILVVDDVAINRDIAASFLRAAGHHPVCADGGAEAVIAVSQQDFDFVLMDLHMPAMDGFEASRRIRGVGGERGRVPIIALTAHAFADHIDECRRAGMKGHISKPFTQDTLLSALAQARESPTTGPLALPGVTGDIPVLPVIDVDCFEKTIAFLTPKVVTAHLAMMAASLEQILRSLQAMAKDEAVSTASVDAVHMLTGSIGMFGFGRVVDAGQRFERAARINSAVPPALAANLIASLEATLHEVRSRMHRALDTFALLQQTERQDAST
jgi:PAS domain S-box-containing protein